MIIAEFIGGPQDGEIVALPGIVPAWHVPFVRQDLINYERGVYIYRLKDPAKRTIHDYDLENSHVPYVFDCEQIDRPLFIDKGDK